MRIRKAFMALNKAGHIVRSQDASQSLNDSWSCIHCNCSLLLRAEDPRCKPWFEHDERMLDESQLRKCAFFDDLTLEERKILELRKHLRKASPVVVTCKWRCVQCEHIYSGEKCCPKCGLGIYSVEVPVVA
ncbi:putative zinc ribbon protein [Citrobacter amalonaticus]|uniref:putative zinc ribbon protein n=1 Tax=Citrobacter amalonaticus TaxID=35703 RepID=UPI00300C3D0A